MRFILLLLPFIYYAALAQQKESTISVSCYVNPELYLKANVIAQVSDKTGKVSCNGNYIRIINKSGSTFYYKYNNRWIALKPQGKTIIMLARTNDPSSKSPSIFKLVVKYTADESNLSSKIKAIAQMNAESDQIKADELDGATSTKPGANVNKPSSEALAKVNKPSTVQPSNPPPAKATKNDVEEKVVVKTTPKTPPKQNKPLPAKGRAVAAKAKPKAPPKQNKPEALTDRKQGYQNASPASSTAVGLRVDFGKGSAGLGPNIKYRFNRNLSLDAALVFFDGDEIGLGAQVEQNFPVRGTRELSWYVGIGPQFLFGDEDTAIALVPVTGLEYNIPGAPLNFSFDWRPNFYLSPGADVEAGRFGLSLRVAF